ncbi:uncharacterized protein B0I36DRAFT_356211 [Microdochium trichocladiopsis]|uniref:Transcription factor domain-containing protein n=1 Tax=Microdochium trichocladiopsis TaxID=1682393 RepID=A0A9P8XQJ0_9PEZI|nr:uncharacterized protein B0I36DRAFT_356211 [Microdochium trichocladiopsis]KAH7012113.1 hypothetical protein B0I36DRAFT_356211 [Microdochium trichocladiopsis]
MTTLTRPTISPGPNTQSVANPAPTPTRIFVACIPCEGKSVRSDRQRPRGCNVDSASECFLISSPARGLRPRNTGEPEPVVTDYNTFRMETWQTTPSSPSLSTPAALCYDGSNTHSDIPIVPAKRSQIFNASTMIIGEGPVSTTEASCGMMDEVKQVFPLQGSMNGAMSTSASPQAASMQSDACWVYHDTASSALDPTQIPLLTAQPLILGTSYRDQYIDAIYDFFYPKHRVAPPKEWLHHADKTSLLPLMTAICWAGSRYVGPSPLNLHLRCVAEHKLDTYTLVKDGFFVQAMIIVAICLHKEGQCHKADRIRNEAECLGLKIGMYAGHYSIDHGLVSPQLEESRQKTWEALGTWPPGEGADKPVYDIYQRGAVHTTGDQVVNNARFDLRGFMEGIQVFVLMLRRPSISEDISNPSPGLSCFDRSGIRNLDTVTGVRNRRCKFDRRDGPSVEAVSKGEWQTLTGERPDEVDQCPGESDPLSDWGLRLRGCQCKLAGESGQRGTRTCDFGGGDLCRRGCEGSSGRLTAHLETNCGGQVAFVYRVGKQTQSRPAGWDLGVKSPNVVCSGHAETCRKDLDSRRQETSPASHWLMALSRASARSHFWRNPHPGSVDYVLLPLSNSRPRAEYQSLSSPSDARPRTA